MKVFETLPDPLDDQLCGATYLGNSLYLLDAIPDNSVDLVLTSPPFSLTRKKAYGNEKVELINWAAL